MSCVVRCVWLHQERADVMLESLLLMLEWAILLMLEWQDHIIRTFLSVDIFIWLACMHVPNWKNVLGVSAVVRCVWRVPNWKNVLCHKMCMVTSGMSRCHARSTTFDARVGNTSDARVARSYHKNFPVS